MKRRWETYIARYPWSLILKIHFDFKIRRLWKIKKKKKDYYLFLGDSKVEVSEKVYKGYWQETNRENYLNRLDKENKLGYL